MEDYNKFSHTFSASRKDMKWPELDFFMEKLSPDSNKKLKILDIWCWNWRLLNYLKENLFDFEYLWIDSSSWMIEEAKKLHKEFNFQILDMIEIDKIPDKFDTIFLIASFHHLKSDKDRIDVLNKIKTILKQDWMIFMTNWNLCWEKNFNKYEKWYLWNWDFNIKIWNFTRYYHSFKSEELELFFTWFEIIENRVFDNDNNLISILRYK